MTSAPFDSERDDELCRLIEAVWNGTLGAEEQRRLEERLECDEAAQKRYLACMAMHAGLLWQYRGHSKDLPPWDIPQEPFLPAGGFPTSAVESRVGYFFSGWPAAYLIATLIFAVGALIGAFTHVSHPGARSSSLAVHATIPDPQADIVGRITGTVDCRWERKGLGIRDWGLEEGSRSKVQGSRFKVQNRKIAKFPNSNPQSLIPNPSLTTNHYPLTTPHKSLVSLGDQFILTAGLMEITYNTGAKVILQGPCTFDVDSADGGFLTIGKLTARVESGGEGRSKVQGPRFKAGKSPNPEIPKSPNPALTTNHYPLFTIKTPTATVTDLGTEFGVQVGQTGTTSAHVFQGMVEVQAVADNGTTGGRAVRLAENEAIQVGREKQEIERVKSEADSNSFVRSEQFSKLAEESRTLAFARWQASSDKLRHDPSLAVYYDFQRRDDTPNILYGAGNATYGNLNGEIHGATWTAGRMHGKHALYFDGDQACVKVNLPHRLTQMTLAAWIAIEFISDDEGIRSAGLLMPDGWDRDESTRDHCHWQIVRDGGICISTPSIGRRITGALLPWSEWGKERWRHVVTVADPAEGRVTFYLDGRAVFSDAIPKHFSATFGSSQIGNWDPIPGHKSRPFRGRIDELLILERAMNEQEVAEMYEAGIRQ